MDAPKKLRRPYPTPDVKAERARLHECRVEYIADLMRQLKFKTGVTHESLSVEWDLPLRYVRQMCVEASRRVRAELADDHDYVLSKVCRALDWVIDDAVASGDRHAVIKAAQVYAHVAGAGAAMKVQVSPDLAALSPEQLQARKAEIIARLTGQATAPAQLPEPIEITVLPEDK